MYNLKVYLVTGGQDSDGTLSTTELLVHGDPSWIPSGLLPSPRAELSGATLNNKILVTGTNIDTLVITLFVTLYKLQTTIQTLQFIVCINAT